MFWKSILVLSIFTLSGFIGCANDNANLINNNEQQTSSVRPDFPVAFPGQTGELDSGYFRGDKIYYSRINGKNVFQGDIILADSLISKTPCLEKTQSAVRTDHIWPNRTVYYTINSDLHNQDRVTYAINHWMANTNLTFQPRSTQADYIRFQQDPYNGCWSDGIGKLGGEQIISLADWGSNGDVIHEIGHAVNLFHEQSRNSRNNDIIINFNNIVNDYGTRYQFYTITQYGFQGADIGPFDFNSIMLYGCYLPSISINPNIPIMTKINGTTWTTNNSALSSGDIAGINYLYPSPVAVGVPSVLSMGTSQQHFAYRDASGIIWDCFYNGSIMQVQRINLGGLTSGPAAVSDPSSTVYNNYQHFAYRDNLGKIWDAWYNGSWNLQQINLGGNTSGPAAVGNPIISVNDRNQQVVVYRDASGIIWEPWFNGSWNLQKINLGGGTSGPAAVGNPAFSVNGNQQHFVYRDASGKIWDAWYNGSWNLQQINLGGKTSGPAAVSDPSVTVYNNYQHFVYRDNSGRIWDAWYNGSWHLQQINLSGLTAGPAAVGRPIVSVNDRNQQIVVYRDASGIVWEPWFNGSWNLQKINLGGGTTGPAAVDDPTFSAFRNQQHFVYRDASGRIWDSWFGGSWNLQRIK